MQDDDTSATASAGPALSEGLGPEKRAVFDRWLRDNGHCEDQHDDMLMPLQRSLNELMWGAWKAATEAERSRCAHVCGGLAAGYTAEARRLDGRHATHAAGKRDGANECAAVIRRA